MSDYRKLEVLEKSIRVEVSRMLKDFFKP